MANQSTFLFVYGTLMSYFNNSFSLALRKRGRLIGGAYTFGELYEVKGYPEGFYNPDSNTRIQGELYELINPKTLLKWLDSYEEITGHEQEDSEYLRKIVPVFRNGQKIDAWMYIFNRSTNPLNRIESGSFVDYIKNL